MSGKNMRKNRKVINEQVTNTPPNNTACCKGTTTAIVISLLVDRSSIYWEALLIYRPIKKAGVCINTPNSAKGSSRSEYMKFHKM
jgi:hypothetical protein